MENCFSRPGDFGCSAKEDQLEYQDWRNAVFNQEPKDPIDADFESEAFQLPLDQAADYIDKALTDTKLHEYGERRLVLGFSLIFNNCFTDFPFLYSNLDDETRCVLAIKKLHLLWSSFIARYCTMPYDTGRPTLAESQLTMVYLCNNFWDRFPLFPVPDLRRSIIDAGVELLESLLHIPNDHIVVSGVEGLCTWSHACSKLGISNVDRVLAQWLWNPTTKCPEATNDCLKICNAWLS